MHVRREIAEVALGTLARTAREVHGWHRPNLAGTQTRDSGIFTRR
jgi:hypothetical protein